MKSPLMWSATTNLINQALDYQSPGKEQASKVVRALKEKSLLKEDVFTSEMEEAMADEVDNYKRMLDTGFCGRSLAEILDSNLHTWGALNE